ncbi:hypothetical protein [Comamonas testosteroni]|uniref:hypothetical protein n=1 Tax=Comamonas testosteroni TaxID=285 RepID=UPI00068CB90D|nr:hypothetical protein [Comamonas testosteroni]
MEDDQRYALDILLGHGMIESNNRLDEYAETIDSIRSTAYGNYIYDELSSAFTYLDLVSTDTSVFDSGVCNEISLLAQQEYSIWQSYNSNAKTKRIERVEVRIKKTLAFIEYLDKEETKEASLYQLTSSERFMPKIKERLNAEIDGVRRSANRQRY